MKIFSSPLHFALLCLALLLWLAPRPELCAQSTNPSAPAKPPETTQADFEKLSLHLQQLLQDNKIAIQKEAQDAAHVQSEASKAQVAAITEQLKRMETVLDNERTERKEQLRSSNLTMLSVVIALGSIGLLAMVVMAVIQWRTMNSMMDISQAVQTHIQMPAPSGQNLLAAGAGLPGKAVEVSSQRLMSVIDRLERRILELEHTAGRPLAAAEVSVDSFAVDGEGMARIPALLGKGQSLLNADKPDEALACYDEILKLEANHPEALVKKGAALERLKQDDEALRCYDRAIAADGSLTIAYLYKGGVFNRQERYNEALECYEQALRVQGAA